MSFTITLIYIAFTFLRPFELWLTGLHEFRPMLVLWVIAFIGSVWNFAYKQKFAGTSTHLLILVGLLVIGIVSASIREGSTAGIAALNDLPPALSVFLLVLLNATTLKRLKTLIIVFVSSILVLALTGIYSYHTGFMVEQFVLAQGISGAEPDQSTINPLENGIAPAKDTSGLYMWRVHSAGTLADPNDFGQILIATMPLLWAILRSNSVWVQTLLLALPYSLLMYATLLTQSRGALVGLAAVGLAVFHRLFGVLLTAGLASMMVLGIVGMSYGGGRAMSTGEESAAQRIDAWWVGIELLQAYPVLGAGYGTFTKHHDLTAHNSFVLCFAELGLTGFFLWSALLVLAYKQLSYITAQPQVRLEKNEHRLADGLRFALIGYFAAAWFLSRTYAPATFLFLGVAVATSYVVSTAAYSRSTHSENIGYLLVPWKVSTLLLMTSAIFAVYLFVILG
jgi:putative inorganic carbon (hco3(-)) transporter